MSGKFEPKTPVQLSPPKDDPISLEELAKADGEYSFKREGYGAVSPRSHEIREPLSGDCAC